MLFELVELVELVELAAIVLRLDQIILFLELKRDI